MSLFIKKTICQIKCIVHTGAFCYLLLTYYCTLLLFIFPVDTKDQMDRYHASIMRNLPYLLGLSFREAYKILHLLN